MQKDVNQSKASSLCSDLVSERDCPDNMGGLNSKYFRGFYYTIGNNEMSIGVSSRMSFSDMSSPISNNSSRNKKNKKRLDGPKGKSRFFFMKAGDDDKSDNADSCDDEEDSREEHSDQQ